MWAGIDSGWRGGGRRQGSGQSAPADGNTRADLVGKLAEARDCPHCSVHCAVLGAAQCFKCSAHRDVEEVGFVGVQRAVLALQ